jgi:hypothetical protein
MNLLDLMADAPAAVPAAGVGVAVGAPVRTRDGRIGTVMFYASSTSRAGISFEGESVWLFIHRDELEVIGPPAPLPILVSHVAAVLECRGAEHGWDKTETVWPGEGFVRLTLTCRRCGEIRGRA